MTSSPHLQTRSLSEAGADPSALVEEVAGALRAGALVLIPTETVYGVACRAGREDALRRLRALKGERGEAPFARLVPSAGAAVAEGARMPRAARRLAARYWPGPLTLVLEDSAGGTTGYRVPGNAFARDVVAAAGCPIVATSANRSGEPPATSFEDALAALGADVDLAVDGGPSSLRAPSTVVRVVGDGVPEVLREGFLDRDNVERALTRRIVFVCTGNTCRSPMAAALLRRRLADALGVPLEELERLGFLVESAGVSASYGAPAAEPARELMRRRGLDLSSHRSRPLDDELVAEAELIVTLTPGHSAAVLGAWPEAEEKTIVLDPRGVPDPIGGSLAQYEACAEHIDARLEELVAALDLEEGDLEDAPPDAPRGEGEA